MTKGRRICNTKEVESTMAAWGRSSMQDVCRQLSIDGSVGLG